MELDPVQPPERSPVLPPLSSRVGALLAPAGLLLIAAVIAFCARHLYVDGAMVSAPPQVITGDEPHYLLMVHSALRGELDLRPAYDRARAGGPELGERFAGKVIDHHAIVVDPLSGEHLDWWSVYDARPEGYRPCSEPGCIEFRRKTDRLQGPQVREAPLHPPLFPLLVATLLKPLSLAPGQVEGAMGTLVLAIALLGVAITFLAARRGGASRAEALAAAALLGLCSPWLVYAKSYFAEATCGLFLLLGLWAFAAERPALAALFAALAAAAKPQYAAVGAAWIVHQLVRRRFRQAARMAAVLALGAAAVLGMNWLVLRAPMAQVPPLQWVLLSSATVSLLDPWHGLLPFVPWALVAAGGLFQGLRPGAGAAAGAAAWAVALNFLLLSCMGSPGVTGDYCYGPRYWVALLPALALCAARFAAGHGRLLGGALTLLALVAAAFAISGALEYKWMFNQQPWLAVGAFF